MEKYSPGFLGKVIPADNQSKMTDFVQNKYDAFTQIYDACKDHSEKISDIKPVDIPSNDPNSLSVKVSTTDDVKKDIKEAGNVDVSNDIITATSKPQN